MMRANFYVLLLAFVLGAFCVAPYCQGETSDSAEADKVENKIIAIVNNDVITEAELDVAITAAISDLEKEYSGAELETKIAEVRGDLMNTLIEDRLILQEAKRRGVIVDDTEIEERFKDVKSRFPSEEEFEEEIERAGLRIDILKEKYKDNIMMAKLVTHEVKDKVVVTPSEIDEYYKKHKDEIKAPESVHVKAIMIQFDENTTESLAKQKADDILRLIKEGRDFSDLAKQYSQGPKAAEGGDLGFVEKGEMREEFNKVIFNLRPGDVSQPIKTDTGYYIFKAEEKKDAYMRPLSEVRDNIENIMFREKAQVKYKEWIAKLKRDAFIQIK